MNDRELLILAASALGRDLEWCKDFTGAEYCYFTNDTRYWNPLESDGDAFRMAVTLNIDISPVHFGDAASAKARHGKWVYVPYKHHAGDRLAATRSAIVIAAARAGKERQAQFIQATKGISKWKH